MTLVCPRCQCEIQFLTGEPMNLTLTEHRLLVAFREHPHEILSKERLLTSVWGWPVDTVATADTGTIRVHISRLRHKLDEAGYPDVILTVKGRGWRLLVPEKVSV